MSKIEGIIITAKKVIPDERGSIRHMLKNTDKEFTKFGEVYFSSAYPGVIKGWHQHTRQTQNYLVIKGMIKLLLFDCRKNSKSFNILEEHFVGELNNVLVTIPPGVANGYKVIGVEEAIICNCSDLPHENGEMKRFSPFDRSFCDYDWDLIHK